MAKATVGGWGGMVRQYGLTMYIYFINLYCERFIQMVRVCVRGDRESERDRESE